jgi:hypothetical protein
MSISTEKKGQIAPVAAGVAIIAILLVAGDYVHVFVLFLILAVLVIASEIICKRYFGVCFIKTLFPVFIKMAPDKNAGICRREESSSTEHSQR